MVERGNLYVVEGGVASGKSTQYEKLKKSHPEWKYFREPGGTDFGEKVRDAVQGIYEYDVDPYAALFAYQASRANLVRGKIIPLLNEGQSVILDRYWYSTYAYQGALGVSKLVILLTSLISTKGLTPDAVFHLDLSPEEALKRRGDKTDLDRYDMKALPFHQEVRKNYHQLKWLYKGRWHVIDAGGKINEIAGEIDAIINGINGKK